MTSLSTLKSSFVNIALACCLVLATACGKKDGDSPSATVSPDTVVLDDEKSTNTVTTGSQSMDAENQVDYFAERYLQADERLKRRQDRIKSALSN